MNPESTISFEQFKKVEIKIGEIKSAEKVPNTDKLLRLEVDFGVKKGPVLEVSKMEASSEGAENGDIEPKEGESVCEVEERDIRQIVSGISMHFPDTNALVGKKCAFVANLEPRMIKGLESQGMIMAVGGSDGVPFSLLTVSDDVPAGAMAK